MCLGNILDKHFMMIQKSLLLAMMVCCVTCSIIYHVIPDDGSTTYNSTTKTFTLQHYLNNTDKYLKSNTEIWFKQGHYCIHNDWIMNNVSNITINGNSGTLSCNKPSVGIAIINVTNITMKNFHIKHCSKNYTIKQNYKSRSIPILQTAALFFNHSVDVVVTNISILVKGYGNGIIGINIATSNLSSSSFTNIGTLVLCENSINNSVGGIMLYYNDNRQSFSLLRLTVKIQKYNYKTSGLCHDSFALRLIMMHKEYSVKIQVEDTNFSDLLNSGALLYYGESCRKENIHSNLTFSNCKITSNNGNGNGFINMFLIEIHSHNSILDITEPFYLCSKLANHIMLTKCDFFNNTNMNSLINILLEHNQQLNMLVLIVESNIQCNNELQFINIDSEVKLLKALSYTIIISASNISSNICAAKNRTDLITLTSGMMQLENSVITNNTNFENIIQLYSSLLLFKDITVFSKNHVRYIFWGKEGSYYVHMEFSTVRVTENFIYLVGGESETYTKASKEICTHQFITKRNINLDFEFKKGVRLNYTVVQDNKYTIPKYTINFLHNETYSDTCDWLANTAFQTANSTEVLNSIFTVKRSYANKSDIGEIPSSVCPCSSTDDYNCSKHEIGSVFSGQTATVKLIIPEIGNAKTENKYTTIMAHTYNTSRQGCHIINAHEISQTHLSHQCNEYNYTIWYNGGSSECELYLGIVDLPETFYVTILPCPLGFSLQQNKQGCDCDQILLKTGLIKYASCNVNDGTIQRPPNSWISGKVINNLNTYDVHENCPFDYCLSHSSYISLSNPDLQCQINRSGLLCGHCPNGLSSVFGSSHCMQCSNMTLFVIIPIALAGILLVLMLFISNLTVTNGAINTLIFYFNIVSINISIFISRCNCPFVFITLSLLNLDLGFKTCFYDGMDDYAKTWLQLVFPVYLIFIALALIMGSRHSKMVQRLTARRGLAVLATLFLLSYTKVLLTVCHAIFFYSTVTHLPSEDTTVVWSVDTNTPLFGIKFTILFVTCLLLFLILLPFDILLLFTRPLMRFKFISTFKPLLDAYFGPYKDTFYYWTGLQLLLRAVFFGISTLDPHVNLTTGTIVLGILLCIQGFVQPFKSTFKNVQESVLLLNLLMLYVITLYNETKSKEELPVAWYLVFPVLIYSIILIMWHCFRSICGSAMKQKGYSIYLTVKNKMLKSKSCHSLHEPIEMENINETPNIQSNYEEFQEPLIAFSE